MYAHIPLMKFIYQMITSEPFVWMGIYHLAIARFIYHDPSPRGQAVSFLMQQEYQEAKEHSNEA